MTPDELIAAIRARASDPARRTSVRPGMLAIGSGGTAANVALGDLLSGMSRLLDAAREGRGADPVPPPRSEPPALRAPASAESLAGAETELGCALPPTLRRAYLEVADGGFGWGAGLLSLERALATYRDLRASPPAPRGCTWPEGLLPLVEQDPGYACVEAATGRVVEWDPEGLTERSSRKRWDRSFSEIAPSVEEWLERWVTAPTMDDIMTRAMSDAMKCFTERPN
jgi:hypothetical protein